jgi:hypothetical protein
MPILGTVASSRLTTPPYGTSVAFKTIASIDTGGGVPSVSFTSIPGTYKALLIRYSARSGRARGANGWLGYKLNDTFANWGHYVEGYSGASPLSGGYVSTPTGDAGMIAAPGTDANSSARGVGWVLIYDYATSGRTKTTLIYTGVTNDGANGSIIGGDYTWNTTTATTSIVFYSPDSTNLSAGKFMLYGLEA